MEIELNPYFSDDACVVYCGKNAYSRLKATEEPQPLKGISRLWRIVVQQKGTGRKRFIHMQGKRAVMGGSKLPSCNFYSYKEAEDVAIALLKTANFSNVSIIETLQEDIAE